MFKHHLRTSLAIAFILSIGLLLSVSVGAAQDTVDRVVIWSAGDNGNVVDWDSDPILQAIEEATNTDIVVRKLDASSHIDQYNAAAATGEFPDIIGTVPHTNRNLIQSWADDDIIAPFTGEVAGAAPNVLAEYAANPTLSELLINNEIYAQPVGWGDGNYPNMGLIHVRQDLLEKYGMEAPETFAQYFDYLRTAVTDGHTGVVFNGNSPNGASVLINAFAGAYGLPMLGWVKTDSGWEYYATQSAMKDAVLLFRQLVTEGLVDPSSWTMVDEARDTFVAGEPASLIFNGGGHIGRIQNDMDLAGNGAREWMLPAPAIEEGSDVRGYTSEPMFWSVSFLGNMPNNNPAAAARVINFLISDEGYKLTTLGVNGIDYEENNGEITLLPGRNADRGFPTAAGGTGAHPIATAIVSWVPQTWQNWQLLYGKDDDYEAWFNDMWENQGRFQIPSYGSLSTTPQWTDFQPTSGELVNRAFLGMMQAGSDEEASAIFDQLVLDWHAAGGTDAQAEMDILLSQLYP